MKKLVLLTLGLLTAASAAASGLSVPRFEMVFDSVFTSAFTMYIVPSTNYNEMKGSVNAGGYLIRFDNSTAAGKINPRGTWFTGEHYKVLVRRAPLYPNNYISGSVAERKQDLNTAYLSVFGGDAKLNPPVDGSTKQRQLVNYWAPAEDWCKFDSLYLASSAIDSMEVTILVGGSDHP